MKTYNLSVIEWHSIVIEIVNIDYEIELIIIKPKILIHRTNCFKNWIILVAHSEVVCTVAYWKMNVSISTLFFSLFRITLNNILSLENVVFSWRNKNFYLCLEIQVQVSTISPTDWNDTIKFVVLSFFNYRTIGQFTLTLYLLFLYDCITIPFYICRIKI